MDIHKTAVIDPKAKIADDVVIGPYSVVHAFAQIGSGTKIGEHCIVCEHATIGKNCEIFTGTVIGSVSQDKKFKGEESYTKIGDNNIIREYVTINRGTDKGSMTTIGNDNLLMAYAHVAHDCSIGNGVVIANCGTLAGHVTVEDKVIVGGLAAAHQFVHIGELSIIGGCSKIIKDVVPYAMCDGHPARVYGLNSVGMGRAGIPDETKHTLKKAFKILFFEKLNIKSAIAKISKQIPFSAEIDKLISFINSSERGISR